ncbi:hypothetical protein [Gaetbulibacter aestuarii]|uniref:Lipoprotein n=1 Tax=Gaetbulibacter aestuarii TaxID=1502358 RepID=A0ABW7MYW7_9FLAO
MKPLENHINHLGFLLAILIFFQSCTVYQSQTISLEEASKSNVKSRVESANGKKIRFARIYHEEGDYFGIQRSKGNLIKIKLKADQIKRINPKNKTMTVVASIGIPIAVMAGVVLAVGLSDQGSYWGNSN